MGELLNISASQYSKIENGRCHINLYHIEALAHNLSIEFSVLYYKLKETEIPFSLINDDAESISSSHKIRTNSFESAINTLREYCIRNGHIITVDFNGDVAIKYNK
jgi:transcriptional regulator with XRE-family HTH domain